MWHLNPAVSETGATGWAAAPRRIFTFRRLVEPRGSSRLRISKPRPYKRCTGDTGRLYRASSKAGNGCREFDSRGDLRDSMMSFSTAGVADWLPWCDFRDYHWSLARRLSQQGCGRG